MLLVQQEEHFKLHIGCHVYRGAKQGLCTACLSIRWHLATVYCSNRADLLVLAATFPVGCLNHKFHREDVSQLGTIAIPSTCDLQQ